VHQFGGDDQDNDLIPRALLLGIEGARIHLDWAPTSQAALEAMNSSRTNCIFKMCTCWGADSTISNEYRLRVQVKSTSD
jgi:hypothetical protein